MAWAARPDRMLIAWSWTQVSAWGSPSAWKPQAAFHKYSRTWMRSTRMWTATPRRAASARTRSSWWRAPSTSTTQVRRWEGSRWVAWLGDRAGQPLRLGLGADPAAALAAWALGGGGGDADDIVGAAGGRGGVVGHPQGGHPFAGGLLAAGQPGAIRPWPFRLGGVPGRLPQRLGAHHHALAVHTHHQHGGVGARLGYHGTGERVDVGGGGHGQLLDLPLAHHLPAAATDRLGRLVERAAHRLNGGQPPQPVAVAPPGQPQGRIGRVDVALAGGAPGAPVHHDRPEDAGQQTTVTGLDRAAGDAVGAGHRYWAGAHRLLLAELAQLEVVLQQLPQQVPAPQVQQLLQLGVSQPGSRLGAQLHGQAVNAEREAANGSVGSVAAAQGGIGASPVGRPNS